MAATSNPFMKAMDARTLGENGSCELTASGVGDPLVALFFKLVRSLGREKSEGQLDAKS